MGEGKKKWKEREGKEQEQEQEQENFNACLKIVRNKDKVFAFLNEMVEFLK